ncbi:MAG: hypothetical protein QGG40_00470, partial [Myxococcota bacterium]|nr:hypothetical protein [Myxococcota bacterium]
MRPHPLLLLAALGWTACQPIELDLEFDFAWEPPVQEETNDTPHPAPQGDRSEALGHPARDVPLPGYEGTTCGWEVDFTDGLPSGGEASEVSLDGLGSLVLDPTAGVTEGTWTSAPVDAGLISGEVLRLDGDRINSVVDGSFDDPASADTNLGGETGTWTGRGLYSGGGVIVGGELQLTNTEEDNDWVGQYFSTAPGRLYQLSYSVDLNQVDEDEKVGTRLMVQGPDEQDPDLPGSNLTIHEAEDWDGEAFDTTTHLRVVFHEGPEDVSTFRTRLAVPDCEIRYPYVDPTGSDSVSFQTIDPGELDCEETLTHASLRFQFTTEGSGLAYLDQVFLDREDQLEVRILDASDGVAGEILQRSTLDTGFTVLDLGDEVSQVVVQVWLRTDRPDASPSVSSIRACSALSLDVQVGEPLATHTDARLGFSGALPPVSEYHDPGRSSLRTECIDPVNGTQNPCWEVLADNGLLQRRTSDLDLDAFEVTWDERFELDTTNQTIAYLRRLEQGVEAGLIPLVTLSLNADLIDRELVDGDTGALLAGEEDVIALLDRYAQHV